MYLRILNGIYTGNPTIFNAQLIQEVREVCMYKPNFCTTISPQSFTSLMADLRQYKNI